MSDTKDPQEKTLRDRFPIYCAVCEQRIVGDDYHIEGVSLAKWVPRGNPGELPENIYKHNDCIPTGTARFDNTAKE